MTNGAFKYRRAIEDHRHLDRQRLRGAASHSRVRRMHAMTILTNPACNDVPTLYRIAKALYVMESGSDLGLFRVGAVGGRGDGSRNNALRRLGQCSVIDEITNYPRQWHYLIIKELDADTATADVTALELELRQATVLENGAFAAQRVRKTDSFRWAQAGAVERVFRTVVNP